MVLDSRNRGRGSLSSLCSGHQHDITACSCIKVCAVTLRCIACADEAGGAAPGNPGPLQSNAAQHAEQLPKQGKPEEGSRRGFARLFGLRSSAAAAEPSGAAAEQQADAAKPEAAQSHASEQEASRELHEKPSRVLGAVRLQLQFCPLSRTPQAAALQISGEATQVCKMQHENELAPCPCGGLLDS